MGKKYKIGTIPCPRMRIEIQKPTCIKQSFWPFFDYGFNAASKVINPGK